MATKEEILGLPFYPHECGSMIECVTKQDALKAIEECDVLFRKKVGCVAKNIRGYWDEDNIIEKIKEANTPSLSDIENKIILNAMFASGDDLASFVSRITNEFLKGKKQKVFVD